MTSQNRIILPRRDGLVGEWNLDGSAIDTSGSGNNGTASNVSYATTYRGYQSQAGVFNGSNAQVSVPSYNSDTRTVCAWVRNTTAPTSGQIQSIFTDATSSNGIFDINYQNSGGTLQLHCNNYNWTTEAIYNVTLGTTWHHVVGVRVATSLKLYLNGALVATGTATTPGNYGSYATIGTYRDSNNSGGIRRFAGEIQGVRQFTRELTLSEIRDQYLEGLRKLGGGSLYPQLGEGLVGYWDMKGDANDIVCGNNGTVTGATLTTDRFGNSNRAYSFNGSSNYIATTLSTPSTHSICFWFKTSASGNNYTFNDNSALSILAGNSAGKIQYDDWVDEILTTTNTYVDGNWHFCVCARANGVTNGSYINVDGGSEIVTGTISSSAGASLDFGHRKTPSQQFWTGTLGEVMIFNRAISASEVKALYQLSAREYILPFE